MTADYEYSRSNRENLLLPIRMQLSENLNVLKKNKRHRSSISEIINSQRLKCTKGPVSENPLAVNVLKTIFCMCP